MLGTLYHRLARGTRAMKSDQWKTYRTRFLVKAKQLNSSLSFTDHLGRQHAGRKGDYLVESCDGVLTITPRQIFEDIYVPMCRDMRCDPPSHSVPARGGNGAERFEPLPMEKISAQKPSLLPATPDPARVRRKYPQPFRPPATRLGLM